MEIYNLLFGRKVKTFFRINVSLDAFLLKNMRKILFLFLFSFICYGGYAQNGDKVFDFLRFPNSTRVNALGGNNVSLVERDPSLIYHNPALLGAEMDGMVNLNYMNYIADINIGSATFTKALKERSAWGVGVAYINYGSIKHTTEDNIDQGTLSVNDISFNGFFSYDLSERWRGGVDLKFLYSDVAGYTSFGLGVDVGLSYYNSDKRFSYGILLKNIGAQLNSYNEQREKLPWDLQMGISKQMSHAPLRVSVTAMYLNKWKFDYIDTADKSYDGDNFFQAFAKHLVIGFDYLPSENFWLGVGFNPKANMDMKLQNGNKLGGFSAGAGVSIKRFDVGVSVARYHPSATSLMLSLSVSLADFY